MGDVEVQMQVSTSATEKKTKKVEKTTKKSSKTVDGGVEITEQTTTETYESGKENLPLESVDGEGETYSSFNFLI